MLRPLPRLPDLDPESDDSDSFGGLADVLEPAPDQDDMTSVSMRRVGPPSGPAPFGASRHPSLRDQHAHHAAPVSIRAPVQIQDIAFADTVFASELTEDADPAPSGPIFFDDGAGRSTHCVTPLAFPLPPAADDVSLATRLRVLSAHIRHAFRRSLEEMREIWGNTAVIVQSEVEATGGPTTTTAFYLRRTIALWSCFQWSRADLARAAMIGTGVFTVAGVIGATTMDFADGARDGATSGEVRVARTLDQHTALKIVIRIKR